MVWNTLFCLAALGQPTRCVPSWLLVKINPVLAKPRTLPKQKNKQKTKQKNKPKINSRNFFKGYTKYFSITTKTLKAREKWLHRKKKLRKMTK